MDINHKENDFCMRFIFFFGGDKYLYWIVFALPCFWPPEVFFQIATRKAKISSFFAQKRVEFFGTENVKSWAPVFSQMLSFAVLIFWNFVLSFQHSARFARRMRRFSTVWRNAILQQPHVYLGWDDGDTDVAADIDWIKLWKIRTKKIHIIVVYKMKGTRSRNNIGRRVKL